MKRVLSGIQPSGQLHVGNYAGAIRQFVDMQETHEMYVFVASYHALTSIHEAEQLAHNVRQVVIDYIAFGLRPECCNIYVQHDVPEVTELAWLLDCVCPLHLMDKATSYKDKIARGMQASVGLYTYPVLQAADILSVDPDLVPVGKDQVQHCEITRDLAQKFNHRYGEVFRLPRYQLREDADVVPGIDGEKMSKSYGNDIDPFQSEAALRKRVMKIKTDSKPMEAVKDPDACTVFRMFRAVAGRQDERTLALERQYREGGIGYGEAKQSLFELIMDHFGPARKRRRELMSDLAYVDQVLRQGAAAARQEVTKVLAKARKATGLI